MRRRVLCALLVVGIVLLVWAFSTRGKEGMFLFSGGAAILLSTLAVFGLRTFASKHGSRRTNTTAIVGALIGLFLGGFIGARTGDFGRVMISLFNPDLPPQDFATSFGAIGGGILGALVLAILTGVIHLMVVRPEDAMPIKDFEQASSDSC